MVEGKKENHPHPYAQTELWPRFPTPSHKIKNAVPEGSNPCNRGITFDSHRDGSVLSHQVATGQKLGGLGSIAALDFPDAVAENTI